MVCWKSIQCYDFDCFNSYTALYILKVCKRKNYDCTSCANISTLRLSK